jgi:hypothetical protein
VKKARVGRPTAENAEGAAEGAEAGRELLCVLCDLCGEKGAGKGLHRREGAERGVGEQGGYLGGPWVLRGET